MNRRIPDVVVAAIVAGMMIAFGLWAYFGDTSLRQGRRMKLARQHLPAITNVLGLHPEFREVKVGIGTGAGGCFLFSGVVETEKDLAVLHNVITAQQPPVNVIYRVKVWDHYRPKPGN